MQRMRMLSTVSTMVLVLVLAGCSVLNRDLMREGTRDFDPRRLADTPAAFKDKLYIFGGVIVETKLTEQGSQIEALFVPVDRFGYLRDSSRYRGRVLAILPRGEGVLDPLIYKKGREITVAGKFMEVRKGKIDEMEVVYPVFEVRQVHLWEEIRTPPYYYYGPYPYYPYGYYPFYDPWWRPYPPGWPPPPW